MHKMKNQLPQLSSMILPAFLTLRKRKNIAKEGIQIHKTFKDVEIQKRELDTFRNYFGFKTHIPLTYLYTIVQRAQAACMLDKQFSLPIPGMVHIENLLTKVAEFDINAPCDIDTLVFVEYKENSSLKPIFSVEISQNGNTIATCNSIYIIKRKSKKKKNKKKETAPLSEVKHKASWKLNPQMGKEYASISGDKNPIHTSVIFAKMLGFRKRIMHGWYSTCRIERYVEEHFNAPISEISVNFSAPVLLPSQPQLVMQKDKEGGFQYQLLNDSTTRTLLTGTMK